MKQLTITMVVAILAISSSAQAGFNGQPDHSTADLGYYYALTGSKFINGQTRTGQDGVMWFIHDAPEVWTTHPTAYQQWKRDGWFAETAGLALTMWNEGSIVYDNNGIETGQTNGFYDADGPFELKGLYTGYSMSNNYDWIYAGYFKIETETSIDQIAGYFAGWPANPIQLGNPNLGFRMNIWSIVEDGIHVKPAVASFTGDVFSSDTVEGTMSWSLTDESRLYSGFPNGSDPIYRQVFTLNTPLILQPGEYFFSHDAVVPEPATMALLGLGTVALMRRRRTA